MKMITMEMDDKMDFKNQEVVFSDDARAEKELKLHSLMSTQEERERMLAATPPLEPDEPNVYDDPYSHMMRLIFNRWKPFLLRAIYVDEGTYFSKFLKQLPITQKVLSQNLKDMQNDGLIYRNVLPEVPPRVEYCLTESGRAMIGLLDLVYDWGWVDMRRKGLPVDPMGEIWHGYRERDEALLSHPPRSARQNERD